MACERMGTHPAGLSERWRVSTYKLLIALKILARPAGIEPATTGLEGGYDIATGNNTVPQHTTETSILERGFVSYC